MDKKARARDISGEPVFVLDVNAICFCVWGALCRVTGNQHYRVYRCVDFLEHIYNFDLVTVNDSVDTTHQQILNIFDQAIAQGS